MIRYKLTVSEPWDFEVNDGSNFVTGSVVRVVDSHLLILKCDEVLRFQATEGQVVLLSPREQKKEFLAPYQCTVNGGIISTDRFLTESGTELMENAKFVLIGSLEPIGEQRGETCTQSSG